MRIINVGIDVGSTTVKLIAMDKDEILFKDYQRHFSNTLKTIQSLLNEFLKVVKKDDSFRIAFTGSGALALAEFLMFLLCKKL